MRSTISAFSLTPFKFKFLNVAYVRSEWTGSLERADLSRSRSPEKVTASLASGEDEDEDDEREGGGSKNKFPRRSNK